jgi:hypothetical protein
MVRFRRNAEVGTYVQIPRYFNEMIEAFKHVPDRVEPPTATVLPPAIKPLKEKLRLQSFRACLTIDGRLSKSAEARGSLCAGFFDWAEFGVHRYPECRRGRWDTGKARAKTQAHRHASS